MSPDDAALVARLRGRDLTGYGTNATEVFRMCQVAADRIEALRNEVVEMTHRSLINWQRAENARGRLEQAEAERDARTQVAVLAQVKAARMLARMAEPFGKFGKAWADRIADEPSRAGFEDCVIHLEMALAEFQAASAPEEP